MERDLSECDKHGTIQSPAPNIVRHTDIMRSYCVLVCGRKRM